MPVTDPSSSLRHGTLSWSGGMVFEGGAPGGPSIVLDAEGSGGPTPVVALLLAAAGCSGSDVVSILEKMRAGLTGLRIEVTGTRREEHPKRFTAIHLTFHMAGTALGETQARRAIDLSIERYCSVLHSLAPDIRLSYDLVLG